MEPYEIYVPAVAPQASGYGLFVNPHAAGGNQNNYPAFASRWQVQVGERNIPYISFTPNARGTAYWYYGQAGAEVFEVWADIAHRYKLDPSITQIGGLSMGGYATWKLAGQFPDLFAATPMIVPCPSAGTGWLQGSATVPGGVASETKLLAPSFRNVPQYIWTGSIDPVCAHWAQVDYANVLDSLGYRYQFFSFIGQGHAWLLGNEFQPMIDWMNYRKVVRDPAHVTFVLNGMANEPAVGLNADHAYWVSGLRLRNPAATPPIGTIDVYIIRPLPDGWRVLVLQRALDTRCPTAWEAVHGHIEPGEEPEDAAVREAREEAGLAIARLYSVTVQPFYLHQSHTVQLAVVFAAFVDEPAVVTLGAEHQRAEWLSVDEALERFQWPRERDALREIAHLLRTGDAGPVEDVLRVK